MSNRIALLATVAALAVAPALAQQSTQPSPSQPAQKSEPSAQPSSPSTSSPTSPSTSGTSPSGSTMSKDSQAQDATKSATPKDTQAQDATKGAMPKDTAATKSTPKFVNTQTSDQWLASDLMDVTIMGSKDEKIGQISDLLVDQQGNIVAAVVGVGGFLGIGQKNVALSFDTLNFTKDKDGDPQARLSLTKEELENAPEFKTAAQVASDAKRPAATPGSSPARPSTPAK